MTPERRSTSRPLPLSASLATSVSAVWRLWLTSVTQFMEEEMKLKMPVPAYDVRRMNKAVESFTTMGPEKALSYMQSLKLADFNPIEVSS